MRARNLPAQLLRSSIILLFAGGSLCLALFFWQELEAHYFQALLSHEFDEQRIHADEKTGGLESGYPGSQHRNPAPGAGRLIGRLEIPRIGLEVMVLNGDGSSVLSRGAGWLPSSAEPGEGGNVVIAAHRDTHFRPLRRIQPGDVIRLTTLDARFEYQVLWTAVVDPADSDVLKPTSRPSLTLITCYPFYYVGSAPQRFIVRAGQQDSRADATAESRSH